MKHALALLAAATVLTSAGAALARDGDEGVKPEGDIGLYSDYRYRGLSLSGEDPALQGSLTLKLPGGFRVGMWGSNIEDTGGGDVEIDLLAGYDFSAGGVDWSVGAVLYAYPGGDDLNYWEVPVSASKTWSAFTGTASVAYAPKQDNLGNQDNWYVNLAGEYAPESWPVAIDGWIGREDGAFADNKLDWALGVSKAFGPISLAAHYIGTDVSDVDSTVVVSLKAGF